jgi:hypothetical protein
MKFTSVHKLLLIGVLALLLGGTTLGFMYRVGFQDLKEEKEESEGFQDSPGSKCNRCGVPRPCRCVKKPDDRCGSDSSPSCPTPAPVAPCPRTIEPDLSKYVLKSSIPPPRQMPELSNYMLKSECPAVPDLSKYVLRSSIPKPQPVIIDNSSCKKDAGECQKCPVIRCPPPRAVKCEPCPVPAPCPRATCKPTVVKCKSEEQNQDTIRPFLAPLNMNGFGSA